MCASLNNTVATERQLVTFRLGEDEFGTDIMDVKEIIRVPVITKVPNAPDYVEGACNLRGNILPIIDGRTKFNLERKEKDENSRVLVIDVEGEATGIIVDKVSEVMRVSTSDIEEAPQIVKNVDSDFLDGVVKLDNGQRLIIILDVVKALIVNNIGKELKNGDDENVKNNIESVSVGEDKSIDEEQLVTFQLDQEEYAIEIMMVKEIIRVPQIVKVPNCEAYIEGILSLRDDLLPIINLRTYFGMGYTEISDRNRILVVDMGNFTAGIMVDKVSEVLRIPKNSIQPPLKFSAQSGEQLKGIAKLSNGKRMIFILEPSKIISADILDAIIANDDTHEQNGDGQNVERQMLDEVQFVTFKIDDEEYGIKIDNVQEINRMTEVTKIPNGPYYIEGIVNLRGNIIPALDLRRLFKLSEKQLTDATRIIIADFNGKRTGIIVDSVSEVLRFEKKLIEAPTKILSSGVDSDYIEGVGKLDDGKRMILILDIGKVLSFS
ncbi:chemotaxis protein CheW [Acetobacterium bakii]|uniref:chemotaxis protein CheW n=1 Tax=Acetobacterium bakii TaxID=52689 RepID=UPI000680F32A|nr:chemotaxis protein CheW [Acetobacterium bakii]